MRIHLATDHAGLEFLRDVADHLSLSGHDVVDHGPTDFDAQDDYPEFCIRAAMAVVDDLDQGIEALGVVFGGSGNGEQIAANKVPGIRAALVWNRETAVLAREHNNANICALGARQHSVDEAILFIDTFIQTSFTGEPRHQRRIDQIGHYESTREIPRSGDTYPAH